MAEGRSNDRAARQLDRALEGEKQERAVGRIYALADGVVLSKSVDIDPVEFKYDSDAQLVDLGGAMEIFGLFAASGVTEDGLRTGDPEEYDRRKQKLVGDLKARFVQVGKAGLRAATGQ